MLRFLGGVFIILHGLVHLWYLTLSQGWVGFQSEMGWDGSSLLLSGFMSDSALRPIASILYLISTAIFLVGGVGVFMQAEWTRSVLMIAAVLSSVVILLFWDGNGGMLVQKGLLGLLIDLVILGGLLGFPQFLVAN